MLDTTKYLDYTSLCCRESHFNFIVDYYSPLECVFMYYSKLISFIKAKLTP